MKTFKIVAGDISLDEYGRTEMITGEDKLVQDVLESLMVATNRDGYGAGLSDMIGTIPVGNIPAGVILKIMQALEYYRGIQSTQYDVSQAEKLVKLKNVTSERVHPGHTDYAFKVYIQNGVNPEPVQVCLLHRPQLRG